MNIPSSHPHALPAEAAPLRDEHASAWVIDCVPQRTCVTLVGIAIAVIAVSVWWSWRMASAHLRPQAGAVVVPVADLGIQVGLFPTTVSLPRQPQPSGYVWVDRRRGIVGVPVDIAMQIYLEKGRP